MKFVLPVRRKTVNINLEGELQSLRATRNTLQKSAAIEHIRGQSFRSVLSRNETNVARSSSATLRRGHDLVYEISEFHVRLSCLLSLQLILHF